MLSRLKRFCRRRWASMRVLVPNVVPCVSHAERRQDLLWDRARAFQVGRTSLEDIGFPSRNSRADFSTMEIYNLSKSILGLLNHTRHSIVGSLITIVRVTFFQFVLSRQAMAER